MMALLFGFINLGCAWWNLDQYPDVTLNVIIAGCNGLAAAYCFMRFGQMMDDRG